jgi:DUF4097 and DUF4098 domain-containing protein YvlB
MSEERLRVLKLLEEGKISADQAARLIQALGRERRPGFDLPEPPTPPEPPFCVPGRRHFRVQMRELDRIPDIVAGAVSSAIRSVDFDEDEGKREFVGATGLFLKTVSGDVTVKGWDKDSISLDQSDAMTKVRQRGDQVMVRAISGDTEAMVPLTSRLELVSVSGDVNVSGVSGEFGLKSVSGDVELAEFSGKARIELVSGDLEMEDVSGEFEVDSKSGDINIEPSGQLSGSVRSKSGDIDIEIGPDADLVLEMDIEEEGEIRAELGFDHEVVEQGERTLKLRIGPGGKTLKLHTQKGDITVSPK